MREEIAAALAAKIVGHPRADGPRALPKAASLPGDIRELALYHKHDMVYESFGRDVQALIAAIEAHRQRGTSKQPKRRRPASAEAGASEIDAARRARQNAKVEADAERRARMEKEVRRSRVPSRLPCLGNLSPPSGSPS